MNSEPLAEFHRRLQDWYHRQGRKDLPWRNTGSAYEIYLSETMLQQTQVATVRERYYFQFLERFPTLAALAAAPREEVLKAWQGLGYYNRAANLHEAAICSKGTLPATVEDLLALPGIGRNTAHAIAAFAYRLPVAILEANVKRVVARIFALTQPTPPQLWDCAEQLLDTAQPFDYNQAMMDIGALVCTRKRPRCSECPANSICQGKVNPEAYPAPKIKKTVPTRKKSILLLRNQHGEYYATPRSSAFLRGLYHFIEADTALAAIPQGAIRLGSIRQQYSHFTLEADIYLMDSHESGEHWHSLVQLKQLPFSNAEHKILALLSSDSFS